MSSDLCKKPAEQPPVTPPGNQPTQPPPDPGPVENIIKNQSLRSKHLKIVSEELYITPTLQDAGGLGQGVQTGGGGQAGGASLAGTGAGLGNTTATLGGRQTPIGKGDVIRGNFLNYLGRGLELVKKGQFDSNSFKQTVDSDEMEFDIRRQDELKANNLFDSIDKNREYTYINFTLDIPFSEAEVRANSIQSGRPEKDDPGFVGGDPRISTFMFEPRYNFFIKKYENKVSNKDIKAKALPNAHVYDFLLESLFDLDTTNYDTEYLKYLCYQDDETKLLSDIVLKRYNFSNYLENYTLKPEVEMTNKFVPGAQLDKFTNLIVTQDDAAEYFNASGKFRSSVNYGYYLEIPYEPPKMQKGEKDIFKNILKTTNTDLNLYNVVIRTNLVVDVNKYAFETTEGIGEGVQTGGGAQAGGASVAGTSFGMDSTTAALGGKQTPIGSLTGQDKILERAFGFAENALKKDQIATLRTLLPKDNSYYTNLSYIEATKNTPVNNFTTSPTDYKTWDLTTFFEKYGQLFDSFKGALKNAFIPGKDKNTIIIGESNEAVQKYNNNPTYDVFQKLMNNVANQQFKKAVNDGRIKNISSMFNELAETPYEVLFYRVEKRDLDGIVLQNFYLPNPDEKGQLIESKDKLIKMFDSQVKYGENNTYEVFAYPLVLAKKYRYEKVLNDMRFVDPAPLANDFHIMFNFFKYYVDNITRVKNAITAKSDDMNNYLDQFLAISNQLVDEAFVLQLKLGAKGKKYQKFISTMKWIFKNMFQQVHGIVKNNVITTTGNNFIVDNKSVVSANLRKYFFKNAITDPNQNWMYSAQEFDKSFGRQVKALDPDYRTNLNSYFVLSRILSNLLVGNKAIITNDNSTVSKSFQKLSGYVKSLTSFDDGVEFDKFKIITDDYIPLMEIPLFSVNAKILDGPPVAPKVSFVPFKDVNNKVMIKLKGENTEYREVPQIINESEQELVNDLINTRGVDKQGRLLFKTDDYLTKFEIYRSEERPKSYTDFSGKLIKKVDLEGKYSSYNYLNNIETNRRYYYTFRSIDEHNNISNPSPVYEFMLNDDGGFLFPEVNIVNFEDTDYYSFESNMQRYIQIRPSAQNIIFDPELINDEVKSANDLEFVKRSDSNPPLGISNDPVWGKDFKLRITSKTSGKKVDINFTFTKKHKIIEKPDSSKGSTLPSAQLYNK